MLDLDLGMPAGELRIMPTPKKGTPLTPATSVGDGMSSLASTPCSSFGDRLSQLDPSSPGSSSLGSASALFAELSTLGDEEPCQSPAEPAVLVVFDWDDTLLPTSWLLREKILSPPPNACVSVATAAQRMTPEHVAELEAITAAAHATLDAAERLGKVILVTNALTDWVEKSGKLVPSLASRVVDRYPVFARPLGMSPSDLEAWKTHVVGQESVGFDTVVSVGDGLDERNACLTLPERFKTRSVKFYDTPVPADLVAQHAKLVQCLDFVMQDERASLDLAMYRPDPTLPDWKLVSYSAPVQNHRHHQLSPTTKLAIKKHGMSSTRPTTAAKAPSLAARLAARLRARLQRKVQCQQYQ
jgi:hypothetical protein